MIKKKKRSIDLPEANRHYNVVAARDLKDGDMIFISDKDPCAYSKFAEVPKPRWFTIETVKREHGHIVITLPSTTYCGKMALKPKKRMIVLDLMKEACL